MADHLLKKARKTTMADLLDELVIEILVRLPAVYLLRYTSVCKSWYSLITSPGFITTQLNKSVTASSGKANNETLQGWICSFDRAEKRYLLYGEYGRFGEEYSELEYPLENQLGYYRILGCCNGVVCLFIRTGHPNIFLWNPSIRKAVNLRMPSMPQGLRKFVLGFGTHPATYECKVIRIAYNMADSIMSEVPPKVELYTQGTGSWGCISSAPSIRGIGLKWSHAFVNGAVHWLVDDSHRNSIVSFDMGSESFSKMMLPPALANQYLHLNLFGESLALVNRDVRRGSFGCCIWVMKEIGGAKSWTKSFSINRPGVSFKTTGLQANGEVLPSTRSNSLISYDPGTEKMVYTGIKGISSFAFYKEALVLLRGGNGV